MAMGEVLLERREARAQGMAADAGRGSPGAAARMPRANRSAAAASVASNADACSIASVREPGASSPCSMRWRHPGRTDLSFGPPGTVGTPPGQKLKVTRP